jgi:two-component system, OmpR family, phosphate regulon response regulator PhoB
MTARILVVEDDGAINLLVKYNLEAEGFSVDVVETGELVLDWMLPGLSGIELCRRIRAGKRARGLPILMLTARGEEGDRIRGLSTGADDYVTKPFSPAELTARIKALLRRSSPDRLADKIGWIDIELDREAHSVTRGGRDVRLGPTEFKLLEYLMRSAGRVLSRSQLLDGVWGRDVYVDERTVDVHIGRLRKCLVRGRERDPIRTVRGAGYVFGDSKKEG